MLMDLLHGFEVLSTTEETLFNSSSTDLTELIKKLRSVNWINPINYCVIKRRNAWIIIKLLCVIRKNQHVNYSD